MFNINKLSPRGSYIKIHNITWNYGFTTKCSHINLKQILLFNRILKKLIKRKKKKQKKFTTVTKTILNRNVLQYRRFTLRLKYMAKRYFLNKKLVFRALSKYNPFNYIINIPWVPYSKKAKGSRMGKGKPSIFSWYIHVNAFTPIFYFSNWNPFKLQYLINKLMYQVLPPIRYKSMYVFRNIVLNKTFSWLLRFNFWQFFFLGFFFDDLFAVILISGITKIFLLPTIFLWEKLISPWMGLHLFKKIMKPINATLFVQTSETTSLWGYILLNWSILNLFFFILFW